MAPRPCLRAVAMMVCAGLLIAIMTTQYGQPPLDRPEDMSSSSSASGRTLMEHLSHHYHYISGTSEDQNVGSVSAVSRPPPDITSLHLDDRTTGMREVNKEARPFAGSIPSIIHLVWCGQRYFEFKHYLAVQSAIKVTLADKVVIHYEAEPEQDELFYYQWHWDLKHDFPFLHLEQISDADLVVCKDVPLDLRIAVVLSYMSQDGGIYMGENTWLLKMLPSDRQLDVLMALQPDSMDGFLGVGKGVVGNQTLAAIMDRPMVNVKRSSCTTISQFYKGYTDPYCLIVKNGRYDSFFPMQIWDLNDAFGRVARKIFYGTEEMPSPTPSFDELVPNIGHMIWLGGGRMDFVFYLSALSLIYVAKVDTLYIHGDQEPKGDYWPRLKADPKVQFVLRPQPRLIYQGEIEWYYRALMSDLIRVDIMIKYGGIYTDTDAIWVKPLTHKDRGYEAVASFDWVDWSYPYPDSVNFGLSYGKKNAPFWRIFRDSMRRLHNDIHGFSGVMMPYKLLEKYPELLRIDRRLSVICYKFRCHPTYVKNYHDEKKDHVTSNSIPNWRNDVYAFHWTHPNPREYANETTLLQAKGMFAEIGQFVLKRAGLS